MSDFKQCTIKISTKTKRTFYTDEKLENMRKNIERYEWAKKKKEQVVAAAEKYLAFGIDKLLIYIGFHSVAHSCSCNYD